MKILLLRWGIDLRDGDLRSQLSKTEREFERDSVFIV